MANFFYNALKKQWIAIIIFIALASFVWFIGPALTINNQYFLQPIQKRLCVIALFLLIWLLKGLVFDMTPKKSMPKTSPYPLDLGNKLQALQKRFEGACEFFKKTMITNKQGQRIYLSHLPWYLLIGQETSGKSTLLAHSNVNFVLAKQFNSDKKVMTPSETCDWWATKEFVLVDVPGAFLSERKGQTHTVLWNSLLNLIHTSQQEKSVNGVLIAINLPELGKQSSSEKNQFIRDLKKRIFSLQEKFGKALPFYFVITKCDLIPGFSDFFSELSSDELIQPWGVSLVRQNTNEKLNSIITQRFNALIKRLNKQLIIKLHQ